MTTFTKGDRVELNQDYNGNFFKGDAGEVTKVDRDTFSPDGQMVYVKLDSGKTIEGVYGHRLNKVPQTAAEKAGLKIGQKVKITNAAFGSAGGYKGMVGTVESSTQHVIAVKIPGYVTKNFYQQEVEAYKATALEASEFELGDRVRVTRNGISHGKLGVVKDPVGINHYIPVVLDGNEFRNLFAVGEIEKYVETKFKVGDRVTSSYPYSTHKGKDLVVLHVEGEGAGIMYGVGPVGNDPTLYHSSKGWYAYRESELEAYVEPAPVFKVGDWVEVHGRNDSYDGTVGKLTERAWASFWLFTPVTGNYKGQELGFKEKQLKHTTEPKLTAAEKAGYKAGDKVRPVKPYKGPITPDFKTKGGVVSKIQHGSTQFIYVDVAGRSELYAADEIELGEVFQPKFKAGDKVVVSATNWGWGGTVGTVTEYTDDETPWVRVTSEKGMKLIFPENELSIFTPKLPKEAGEVIRVTKYDGEDVDLIAMCDGTNDSDNWFAAKHDDNDGWLYFSYIEAWEPAKVTVS